MQLSLTLGNAANVPHQDHVGVVSLYLNVNSPFYTEILQHLHFFDCDFLRCWHKWGTSAGRASCVDEGPCCS